MKRNEAQKRIEKLRETIEYHRYLYHVRDTQEVSDAALDSLKHELFQLEQKYPELITSTSPTQRVGGQALDKFLKVTHRSPMLSMEDVFLFEELQEWEQRLKRLGGSDPNPYYTELKMDGVAASLWYRDGLLVCGATRGDGKVGEDVTQNIKTIEAIPLHLRKPSEKELKDFVTLCRGSVDEKKLRAKLKNLTGIIEVRGEMYMTKKSFDSLNTQQKKKGENLFANPRNATAGSIRQLDPKCAASRSLDFYGYALQDEETFGITTHEQAHALLQLIGVKVNPLSRVCETLSDIYSYYGDIQKKRERLPYWTDGVVVVVNTNHSFEKLGVVGKTPRGIIAYKFPAEQVTTVVKSVHFQIGRTGVLTPVATFEPVHVAGTTVTHATLHNADEIERLDIRIGDTVVIEKAGDIIPKVVSVVTHMRTGKEKKIEFPKDCPACASPVIRKSGEVALVCQNKNCFAREQEALIHFVSKKGFDIDGLGEKICEQLLNQGLIRNAADLFTLKEGDLLPLERFASKSAANICTAIYTKRISELPRFLYALGIHHAGEETAYDLANHFGTLEKIGEATREELEQIPHIGPIVAQSVSEYFQQKKNKEFLEALMRNGVKVLSYAKKQKLPLEGKIFVVTGTLSTLSREEAEQAIRDQGGSPSSSVSSKTEYVVVGKNPGSKEKLAKKLNVKIIDEQEFLELMKHEA